VFTINTPQLHHVMKLDMQRVFMCDGHCMQNLELHVELAQVMIITTCEIN